MSTSSVLIALETIQPLVYGGLAILALIEWRRHPGGAGAWLCAAFFLLGAVAVAGRVLPETSVDPWVEAGRKALIAALVLFPYCLYRFMGSLVRTLRWVEITAAAVTVALALAALVLPSFPVEGEPRPAWFEAYIAVLLVQWVTLSALVAFRLWRAGRDQPAVARRRMRTMSLGAAGLALALVVGGEFSNGGGVALIVQLLALGAAPLMLLGFAPPYPLRVWWRRGEEGALKEAQLSLMEATTTREVADSLVAHARRLLGGDAALLDTTKGELVAIDGVTEKDAGSIDQSAEIGGTDSKVGPEHAEITIPLQSHRLTIVAGPFTPFFGREEIDRVEGLAALADLALARNSLASDQRLLAAIVESSNDAVIAKTLDGTVTSWNRGAQEMYGYKPDEIIGKSMSILAPEVENDVPAILERIKAGQIVTHYQTRRRTKAGKVIEVSLSVSPLRDTSGEIVGASAIARDITEAEKLRAELEEQAAMLDLAQDAIIARDLTGAITYWNLAAEERYGWSKAEAVGRMSLELLQTRFHEARDEIEARLLREGRWEGELTHRTRTGEEVIVASRWALRRNERGDPLEVLEVNNDITEQKAAEAAVHDARDDAERANLAKSDFLSRMSHELRTPLNAILGFGQLLELEDLSDAQRDSTEQIVKGGRRLLELINEVLDIARIESGNMRLSLEPVLIDEVVHDAVELIRPLANEREIRLRTELKSDVATLYVIADRQRLGQILLNLLSNAVKYNVKDGTVLVTAVRAPDDGIRIGVTDTGPGIPDEKVPLLFTPFERLGAEQTTVEGTGLGLSLSKSLIEAMGGSLDVDTMMGEGTTFWVGLHATEAPSSGEALPKSAPDMQQQPGSAGKILYIEDNLSNLRLIERIISQRADVELIPAMTGALGVDLAQQHTPDLVLLDLHLPDVRGDEVLIRLRKDPRTRTIPIVILSADATPGEIERLRAAGADDYLTKPINVVEFITVIDRFLRSEERF